MRRQVLIRTSHVIQEENIAEAVEGSSLVIIDELCVLHHLGPICPLQRHYHLSKSRERVPNLSIIFSVKYLVLIPTK